MLGNLGNAELSTGDLDSARGHLHESLSIARALNDHYGVAYQTFNLGLAEYLSGALSTAEGYFAESLDLDRRMGMKAPMAYALIGLAMTGRKETDVGRVRPAARRRRPGSDGTGPHHRAPGRPAA